MITMNQTGKVQAVTSLPNTIKTRTNYLQDTATISKPSSDSIEISAMGAYQAKLDSVQAEGLKTLNEGVSEQRIQQLKEKYANGQCPVSSREMAGAMLRDLLGEEAV